MASVLNKRNLTKGLAILAGLVMMSGHNTSAQNALRGGYFTDGYQYRYKINPAIQNDLGFMSLPAIGGLNVNAGSNVGLKTFLYTKSDKELTTFMAPSVSAEEFLSNLPEKSKIDLSTEIPVISFGFRTGRSYHTFDISAVANANISLPSELFRFIKTGETNISAKDLSLQTNVLSEIAYGYSYRITDRLTVGARFKALAGFLDAGISIDRMDIAANDKIWMIGTRGKVQVAGEFEIEKDADENLTFKAPESFMPSLGAAADLGFEYRINDIVAVSASVQNLGFINWRNSSECAIGGSVEFEGFNEVTEDSSLDDQLTEMINGVGSCFAIDLDNITTVKRSSSLDPIVHAGVQVFVPGAEKLSFGVLATSKLNKVSGWNEIRLSANYAPSDWFSISANVAESTFGIATGALMSIHSRGIAFFLGTDNFLALTKLSPQGIPVNNLSASISMGLGFTFGQFRN